MGSKKINGPYHLISAGSMTGTATILSSAQTIQNFDNVGLHVIWNGTAVGTVSVLCSIDGVTYDALTFSPALTQPAGTAGSYLIDLNQVPFPFLEVKYVNASGSGTLNVWLYEKDVN